MLILITAISPPPQGCLRQHSSSRVLTQPEDCSEDSIVAPEMYLRK